MGLFDATTNRIESPLTVAVGGIDKRLLPTLDDDILEVGEQVAVSTPEPASMALLPLLVLATVGAALVERVTRRLPRA